MKKAIFKKTPAFTMLELVFIIIIVGILAAVLIPRMGQSRLREAADQVVSHIRYTQHLAMMDDKFGIDDTWYKARWQIHFMNQTAPGSTTPYMRYVVFADTEGNHSGNPSFNEMASNPLDTSKKLTSGGSTLSVRDDDKRVTRTMNLGKTYDITDVVFAGGCSDANTLSFDYLGRPMVGDPSSLTDPYRNDKESRLLTSECTVTLENKANEHINITVQQETGYASVGQIY